MNRVFGLMSKEDVKYEVMFLDFTGNTVLIQAGPYGWTICWADASSDWEDVNDTPENNFEKAYRKATEAVGPLTTK